MQVVGSFAQSKEAVFVYLAVYSVFVPIFQIHHLTMAMLLSTAYLPHSHPNQVLGMLHSFLHYTLAFSQLVSLVSLALGGMASPSNPSLNPNPSPKSTLDPDPNPSPNPNPGPTPRPSPKPYP